MNVFVLEGMNRYLKSSNGIKMAASGLSLAAMGTLTRSNTEKTMQQCKRDEK
jgi:hypothetical protein